MEIESGVRQEGCWGRLVFSCKRYCYFVSQLGIRTPTAWERTTSAIRGLCGGLFVGALMNGFAATTASICELSGASINEDLYWKIVIPLISTPPLGGAIHGAFHPREEVLRTHVLITNEIN